MRSESESYKHHEPQECPWRAVAPATRPSSATLPPRASTNCRSFFHQMKPHRRSKTEGEKSVPEHLVFNGSMDSVKKYGKLFKEPRNLHGAGADQISLHPARWPAGMQVLSQDVKHISAVPNYPEPFANPCLTSVPSSVSGRSSGEIVFLYSPETSTYFLKSYVGGQKIIGGDDPISLTSGSESSLVFESRFEGGNLEKAVKISENAYNLYLRSDLYTQKHNQWYYFMIRNTRAGIHYKFSIMNLHKPSSLYNMGMKPLFYSETDAFKHNIGWVRNGYDVSYSKSSAQNGDDEKCSLYNLTFYCEFPHDNDVVFFAHCYPYTYSMLQKYLQDLHSNQFTSSICKQRVLCRSLAGNYIYILTVTAPGSSHDHSKKKIVVITARVHPGETNSSFMVEGIINYIIRDCPKAETLRQQFIFKIVPMLNPDGVIVGNSRCSLSGRDLNRCYRSALKESFPSVWHTKQLIKRLMADHDVVMYCDLHGHSRKHNVFIYGCENKKLPKRYQERLFPLMFHYTAPDSFSFESCQFKVQKAKEGTSRVVIWQMGMLNSFTIEASLCGSSLGKKAGLHFNVSDFRNVGEYFCQTLLDYCSCDRSNVNNLIGNTKEKLRAKLLQSLSKDSPDKGIASNSESSSEGESVASKASLPRHMRKLSTKHPDEASHVGQDTGMSASNGTRRKTTKKQSKKS